MIDNSKSKAIYKLNFIFINAFCTIIYLLVLPTFARAQTNTVIFEDDFETNLNQWTITKVNPADSSQLTTNPVYSNSKSLLLNYLNDNNPNSNSSIVLEKSISPISSVLVRVYYYDHLSNQAGSFISIEDSNQNNISIGVNTGQYSNSYFIRRNANWYDSGIARKNGWHMFEFIIMPNGTYTKIDNQFQSPIVQGLTQLTKVKLAATWDLFGQASFDKLTITSKDVRPWQQQSRDIIANFYQMYSGTDFTPVTTSTTDYTRSILNTANSFYTYATLFDNTIARDKAINLFKSAITHPGWNNPSDWELGNQLTVLSTTAQNLWPNLDLSTKSQTTNLINDLANTFLTAKSIELKSNNSGTAIATYKTNTPQIGSRYANIYFYDDLSPSKITFIGAYNQLEDQYTLIGVNTDLFPNTYFIRTKNGGIINSNVQREKGWRNFGYDTSVNGTIYKIDSINIGINTDQKSLETVKVATPYLSSSTATFDHFMLKGDNYYFYENFNRNLNNWNLEITGSGTILLQHNPNFLSFPKSKYVYDTKAEDNAWSSSGLASAINFFEINNESQLLDSSKCLAFHSITTSTDNTYCGFTTQTVYDDFKLENHGYDNPVYSITVLSLLAQAAQSFQATNQAIPSQYNHNNLNLLNKAYSYADPYSYIFPSLVEDPDWHHAADTFDRAILPLAYFESIGQIQNSVTVQKLFESRSLTFYNVVSHWQPYKPSVIYNQGHPSDPTSDGFVWLLNAHFAGSILSPVIQNYVISKPTITPPIPSPTIVVQPGDTNSDNKVDMADYSRVLQNYNQLVISNPNLLTPIDLNGNGIIDLYDYSIVITNFGETSPSPTIIPPTITPSLTNTPSPTLSATPTPTPNPTPTPTPVPPITVLLAVNEVEDKTNYFLKQDYVSADGKSIYTRTNNAGWGSWTKYLISSINIPNSITSVRSFTQTNQTNGSIIQEFLSNDGSTIWQRDNSTGSWVWNQVNVASLNIFGQTKFASISQSPGYTTITIYQNYLSANGQTLFSRSKKDGAWTSWTSNSISNIIPNVSVIRSFHHISYADGTAKQEAVSLNGQQIYQRINNNGWGTWNTINVNTIGINDITPTILPLP